MAGVQGTYGWSVQSGAVTFSAGLIFNVAAVAAGDFTVNSVSGSVYAGGTVTLSTQDPTLPRVDIIVITSGGAVSAVAGTPAALTSTSGPVPPTPTTSQLEIARIFVPASGTPLSASSITDRRHPLVVVNVALAASASTITSTTSTSAVDLVTLTPATAIAATAGIRITFNWRKNATNATAVAFGLKLNSTVIIECAVGPTGVAWSEAGQFAVDGICVIDIAPRRANYTSGIFSYFQGTRTATFVVGTGSIFSTAVQSAALPTGTITSLALRAINLTSTNGAEITDVKVVTY